MKEFENISNKDLIQSLENICKYYSEEYHPIETQKIIDKIKLELINRLEK